MRHYPQEDIVSHALDLISGTGLWLLARHQWIINSMRCVLTGEEPQSTSVLPSFSEIIPKHIYLPDLLMNRFNEISHTLESLWDETAKSIQPMSGLTLFEQLNNYQTLAYQFMVASKEAQQQLIHEFAMRDTLTGVLTRLTLMRNLDVQLERAKQSNLPASIALLDQNDFKAINDQYGHVVGDSTIAITADIIGQNLRPHDQLYRYGGDEWLIIMPATSLTSAKQAIDRIYKIYISHAFKSTCNENFFTSFSYGIAESKDELTAEKWIAEADMRLYDNKANSIKNNS
jgi:diguanylate cyclase (GGDEF)-like protein